MKQRGIKFSTKIMLLSSGLVIVTILVLMALLLAQKGQLAPRLEALIRQQAYEESSKLVQTIYNTCAASEASAQATLRHDLEIARSQIQGQGAIAEGPEKVVWDAENQSSHQQIKVALPQLMVGTNWLGQNFSAAVPSPIVDETKRLTRAEATLFQRMNDAGDMVRVCTSAQAETMKASVAELLALIGANPQGSGRAPQPASLARGRIVRSTGVSRRAVTPAA